MVTVRLKKSNSGFSCKVLRLYIFFSDYYLFTAQKVHSLQKIVTQFEICFFQILLSSRINSKSVINFSLISYPSNLTKDEKSVSSFSFSCQSFRFWLTIESLSYKFWKFPGKTSWNVSFINFKRSSWIFEQTISIFFLLVEHKSFCKSQETKELPFIKSLILIDFE